MNSEQSPTERPETLQFFVRKPYPVLAVDSKKVEGKQKTVLMLILFYASNINFIQISG